MIELLGVDGFYVDHHIFTGMVSPVLTQHFERYVIPSGIFFRYISKEPVSKPALPIALSISPAWSV